MKFYQRAYLSITRQLSKSLILLLVTFILGSGIIISFLIKSAISEASTVMLNRSNSAVTLSLNSNITDDVINKIGKSSYVKNYDYNINSLVTSSDIEHYTGDVEKKLLPNENIDDYFDTNFQITGVNDSDLLLIKQGKARLKQGRTFFADEINQDSNSVIITDKLAQANSLSVGSQFEIKTMIQSADKESYRERSYEVKVAGIINVEDRKKINSTVSSKKTDEREQEFNDSLDKANYQNMIIAPNSLTKQINNFASGAAGGNNGAINIYSTPVFILNSPHNLKNFIDEESSKLPKNSQFVSDYDNIEKSLASTVVLNNIASVAFVTMTFLTVTVLGLVVVLFLVDRKKEFGIYQALGEKKYKTIGQIVIETCLIGLTGFCLAIATSSFVATTVSESIMKNTHVVSQKDDNISASDVLPYLDESNINDNYIVNNYRIRISLKNVLFILAIGTSTLLIASVGPSIYILRLQPKDILL